MAFCTALFITSATRMSSQKFIVFSRGLSATVDSGLTGNGTVHTPDREREEIYVTLWDRYLGGIGARQFPLRGRCVHVFDGHALMAKQCLSSKECECGETLRRDPGDRETHQRGNLDFCRSRYIISRVSFVSGSAPRTRTSI